MISQTSINVATEKPLVILKRYKRSFLIGIILLLISFVYGIFGTLMPVLATGDYNAILWASDKRPVKNIIMFYGFSFFVLFSPYLLTHLLKTGNYYFYNDRLEVKPFLGRKTITIPYKKMHVWSRKNWNITITLQSIPGLAHPIQHYRVLYREGLVIPMISGGGGGLENPVDAPKALQILKEKAFEFAEKHSIF